MVSNFEQIQTFMIYRCISFNLYVMVHTIYKVNVCMPIVLLCLPDAYQYLLLNWMTTE